VTEFRGPSDESLPPILSGGHLPALDGLRACSVFVVMTYHFGLSRVPGDLGVSAFFVLSGFLITWLLLKEFDRRGTVSLRDFYLRRVLRIFPAYYVFLTFSLAFDLVRGDGRARGLIVPGFAYLMNYYNALHGHPTTSIAHAWSLAIEEQFYLLWPALFLLLSRRSARQGVVTLCALVLLFSAWRTFLFLTGRAGAAYVYNAFDTRADILALGCLLAFAVRLPNASRWCATLTPFPAAPFVTIALLLLSRMGGSPAYHYSVGFTIDAILLAVLILQLLTLHGSGLWRWLDNPSVRYIGAISYPLYLYHTWGGAISRRIVQSGPTEVRIGVAIVISVMLASLSYYIVERPFIRLKTRVASGRSVSSIRPQPAIEPV